MHEALESTLSQLPLESWKEAYEAAFPQGEELSSLILGIAKGEKTLDGAALWQMLSQKFLGTLSASLWRIGKIAVPAVFCGILRRIKSEWVGKSLGEILSCACFLLVAGCMAEDLWAYRNLTEENVQRMADLMQSLFPLLLTLMAAVGGTAGAAFFQPAVVAASGTMIELVRSITLPLAISGATAGILHHLSPHMRLKRLSALLQSAAKWTLGTAFTIFMSVTAFQSLGVAAADGISMRTAKYAVDHFVPVVGGMFADTMDTLAGASLLIRNALGGTGLLLLMAAAAGPLLQTLAAALVYRICGALLEPVSDEGFSACVQDFSGVLMMFFVIQLSVGAMFLLLVAQMLVVGNLTVMLR